MFKNSVPSGATSTSGGERENGKVSHQKTILSGPEEEGFFAMQFTVKCLIAPTLRVSLQ